ncbi:uncharacterized protein LOC144507602 [Mustelus asterias]
MVNADSSNYTISKNVTRALELGAGLLTEEESKIALIDKLNCEQQKNQQHISELKSRLEEMEDLLLAKMKELTSRKDVSLQGDISAFKCMLESEERRLQDSRSQCNKKCSPCKPFLPPRTSPMNQSSCPRAPAATSCPPVNLRSCPPPPISNPCKSLHQGCGTSSPAPRSSLTPTAPLCCPPSSALTTRLPVYQGPCPPSSLASCLSAVRPNCFPPPLNPPCPPPSRLTCPPPSALALCASMSRPRCPSPRNSCPPVGPSANCRLTSSRPGTAVPVAYPKPCHPPEAPRFRQEQYVGKMMKT